jgi:small subunit ribosomal protein S8e
MVEDITESPANPNYVRRNIITKGALIETSERIARVTYTARTGQCRP